MGAEQTSDEAAAVVPAPRSSSVDAPAGAQDLPFAELGQLAATGARGAHRALLQLQRGAGNANVARLLSETASPRQPAEVSERPMPLRDILLAHERAHQATPGVARSVADGPRLRLVRGVDDRELQIARWAQAGLTPAQGRVLARDTGSGKGAKSESCLSSESEEAVFDADAEQMAKEHQTFLEPSQDDLSTSMPLGYKPRFELHSPESMGADGNTFPTYHVRQWFVLEPGDSEPYSKPSWGGNHFSIEMDKEGEWIVLAKLVMDGKVLYIGRRVKIVAAKNVADEAFKDARTASLPQYLLIMHQERVRLGGADLDQSKVTGAYITNEGPDATNPAAEKDTYSFAYRVHPDAKLPADRKPSKYGWWAIPRETDMNRFKGRTDMGRRTEYKGEFAFYLGDGEVAHFRRDEPATVEIVCELVDSSDHIIDIASYQQVIMGHRELEAVNQIDKLEAEAARNYAKIQAKKATGLKAMHVDVRRNKTEDLQLFYGPSAADPTKTMLIDLTPGAEYVEHEGADLNAAIAHLGANNSYSTGEILIQIEGEAQPRRLKTTGESDLADAAGKTGVGSIGLLALGVVAGLIPGADVAAPFLITAGLGVGAASAGLSLADELRKAKPSPLAIAMDVAAIAGSFLGIGATAKVAQMGSVELALTTATGRFAIYTGFAFDAAGGILLQVDTAQKIEAIRNSNMPEDEKIKAIEKLLAMAVITGGLIAFGARDMAKARTRVATILGEERVAGLHRDQVYALGALDDNVLAALKRVPPKDLEPVAAAVAKDPRAAARLSKAYGEKFINEVRAHPERSLKEIGEMLGAESEGVEVSAIGGTRGPDVYERDPAKGVSTNKERFKRGINATTRGRLKGATIENLQFNKTADVATLDLKFSGERVAVKIELKKTAELAGKAHQDTGGAGAGRIIDVQPPAAAGDPWTAHIQLDAATLQEDVKFVLGHEFDEITDFISTKGAAGIGSWDAEAEAGVFMVWADRKSTAPPHVTSHDRANAREFLSVSGDVRDLRVELGRKPGDAALTARLTRRQETLKRLIASMGLRDPQGIELKLRTLRESFAELEDVRRAALDKTPFMTQETFDLLLDNLLKGVTVSDFTQAVAGKAATNLTDTLVAHLMRAEPVTAADFATNGIYGGHHDAALREFIAANPEYAVVLRAETSAGGITYRYYDQYRWNGAGPAPRPGEPRYPTAGGTIDPGWVQPSIKGKIVPKTTFDDPVGFFAHADAEIDKWKAARSATELAGKLGERGPEMFTTNPDLWMYFSYDPARAPGTEWNFRSIFTDEGWIMRNQVTATPAPGTGAPPTTPPPAAPPTPPPATVPSTPPPVTTGAKK